MISYLVSKKVMISAGEASGELYGALLSREIKNRWPDTEIFGIGGSRMDKEGVSLIAPTSQIVGIAEAVKHLGKVRNTLKKAAIALADKKPDILVLIDYPDFNLMLAKHARDAGIPVLYYVSPQVWAWRRSRVKKIAALADRLAVLFPFEVDYYKNTSLRCEFVGHPIAETMNPPQSKEAVKAGLGLDVSKDVVSLLPGSRPDEIRRHKALVIEAAEKLHHEFPHLQIVIPLTAESDLTHSLPDYVRVIKGHTSKVVACSEAAAVASGTATLETALAGTPMVVFYRVSPVSYLLAKLLIKIEFISLVNILSGKRVVMEYVQSEARPENIVAELRKILTDRSYRDEMISNLRKISSIMLEKRPSPTVAAIVGEMAGWEVSHAPL